MELTGALTLVAITALALIGLAVEDHLRPTSLAIEGTPSAAAKASPARASARARPSPSSSAAPAGALERQGRQLATVLRRDRTLTVISPWDPAPAARKLPAPPPDAATSARSRALLLLDYHVSLATRSIITAKTEQLPRTLPDLVDFTLSPCLGADRAAELARESRSD